MVHYGKPDSQLLRAIYTTPIIDNHAHPLLKRSALSKHSLLTVATEAHGDALADAPTGLAHVRMVNQLAGILGCEPIWDAVVAAIDVRRQVGGGSSGGYEDWVKRCMAGIEAVLVDDGLDSTEDAEAYDAFDEFTPSKSRRIVRIEQVLVAIIDGACAREQSAAAAFTRVCEEFEDVLEQAMQDPVVVGFKSVICYRTGLAIPRVKDEQAAQEAFTTLWKERRKTAVPFKRLNHPGLNEYFVHMLAEAIRDSVKGQGWRKPIQFHTGLGDNDITLCKASPSHMQGFIRAYPSVPIVLLHASYPFTREAGYLAAMYANVYADIGEVFPFISRDGQEGVVRQVLELCPASKILWSTDGHWFPETYLLAVEQMREVFATVLGEYVRKGDLNEGQAVQLVKDVLFNNSNKLYKLDLVLRPISGQIPGGVRQGAHQDQQLQILSDIMESKNPPRFLRMYWNDMTGTTRMRAVPMKRALSMLQQGETLSFGITKASLGLLQNDMPAPGVSGTGEYKFHLDLSTIRPGPRPEHMIAMGNFKEQDGSPVELCPRSVLQKVLASASNSGLEFLVGFEIELILLRRVGGDKLEPLDGDGHAWGITRVMEHDAAIRVVETAIEKLDEAGICVDMVHPEAANGQYEIVLPKAPALEAVDVLVYARDIISACATAAGYKMTLHPKLFKDACGTAAHAHMSISSPGGSDPKVYEPFYAGILNHLRAICAFTYSNDISYERAVDSCWAGGRWVAWGTQNRETPLRKIEGSHWEVKCMDGLANPYLAMAALIGAGLLGVLGGEKKLPSSECAVDPALLSADKRKGYGIVEMLPGSLGEALDSLSEDSGLSKLLGPGMVKRYGIVKFAEAQLLRNLGTDEERRKWIMERY